MICHNCILKTICKMKTYIDFINTNGGQAILQNCNLKQPCNKKNTNIVNKTNLKDIPIKQTKSNKAQKVEAKIACPSCGEKTNTVIKCGKCGKSICDNCSTLDIEKNIVLCDKCWEEK